MTSPALTASCFLCQTHKAGFGFIDGDLFKLYTQLQPHDGDIVAAQINGTRILGLYQQNRLILANGERWAEFELLGVVKQEETENGNGED
jgi:hypothetical protein